MSQNRSTLPITYAKPTPTLAAVRAYLTQHGYTMGRPIRKGETIVWETWHLGRGYIELPCLFEARDFPQRMSEFLRELARLEGYDQTGPLYEAIMRDSLPLPVGVIGP